MTLIKLSEIFECHTQLHITDYKGWHSGENSKVLCYVDYIPFEYEECEIEIIKVISADHLLVIVKSLD